MPSMLEDAAKDLQQLMLKNGCKCIVIMTDVIVIVPKDSVAAETAT